MELHDLKRLNYNSTAHFDKHASTNGDIHRADVDFSKPFHTKAHSCNGELNRSIKLHSSSCQPKRPTSTKAYAFDGDLRKTPRISRQWLFLKRRIFISCTLVLLLMLGCLAYPVTRVYPTLKQPFLVRPNEALSFPLLNLLHRRHVNETLLTLAKVDIGANLERANIYKILDGSWHRAAESRYPFLQERLHHEDHYSDRFYERRRPLRTRDERLPLQLSRPRYAPYWAQFSSLLRLWVQKKHYDPHVMKDLLNLVKGPIDKHYLTNDNLSIELGKPYKTCAVVGNSGILLNQSHAAFIDSHEMVMRLNNAHISGFEQYVGSKTTLSFVNSNILHTCARRKGCYCHPYGPNVPLVMYICQVVHFMDVAMCGSAHDAPVIVTDPRFDTLCARIVKYYSLKRFVETTGRQFEDWSDAHEGPLFHYSSGMQAVLLAVGMCERVSIFGFGKSEASKHHYHTSQKAELRLHDYAAEYDFYVDLATRDPQLIPFLNEAGFPLPSVHIYW